MLTQSKYYPIVLALAGVLQTISLVESLAKTGKADPALIETQLRSLLALTPDSALAVYGNETNLLIGLHAVIDLFDHRHGRRYTAHMHYLMALIYLQNKLRRNTAMCQTIHTQLQQIAKQTHFMPLLHPTLVNNIAHLYLDTLATYRFRVQVHGKNTYLTQDGIIALVRALLFSGVRAAMLWRQVGGNRLQFLFARHQIMHTAMEIIDHAQHTAPR